MPTPLPRSSLRATLAARAAALLLAAACGSTSPASTTAAASSSGTHDPCAGVVLDDGDPCTNDACDETTGAVTHTRIPGCTAWIPTAVPGAPLAREEHTAVWTGSKMIIWGGKVNGVPRVTDTGGVLDATTEIWKPTSTTGAPSPRSGHLAVWTGSRMLIWGGFGLTSYLTDGALYDPATDTWKPMTTAGAPTGRTQSAGVWTGSAFLVWGGMSGNALADGASYDPAHDVWSPLSTAGAPSPRGDHVAVWTTDRMVVWSGTDGANWFNDGAQYAPAQDTWTGLSLAGAPGVRQFATGLWSGSAMVVWGGWNGGPYLDTGGAFDPASGATGAWTATSTSGAPSARQDHTALWIGSSMMIWGGCGTDTCATLYGDGGLWTPSSSGGTWEAIPTSKVLTARHHHTAVWTGTRAIVWGGRSASGLESSGAHGL